MVTQDRRDGTIVVPASTIRWAEIVDNAIVVIEKIETLIHGNRDRLFWLHRRSPSGPFPPEVFD